jgi:hypothetical protein
MSLQELLTVPESVRQAAEVVAALDRCFLVGFGRLGPEQNQALQAFGRICAGTPLAGPVGAAVEALGRNEFVDRHFAALAAGRAAIQGAQCDALRAQAQKALGRSAVKLPEAPKPDKPTEVPGNIQTWQESTRNWLMELALAGFQQLESPTLAPFVATLEHLQGEPRTSRLAAILTGFLQELLEALPISALPQIPLYRWVDLWTRSMVASLRRPDAIPSGKKVRGQFSVLGVDLHHHGYFASFDVYGLLDVGGTVQLVRSTLSSYKVDVVLGSEMWSCFPMKLDPLLKAISQHLTLQLEDTTLLPSGDLVWDGKATPGKSFSFLDLAAQYLAPGAKAPESMPEVAPADRHPVQLSEPIYLAGYKGQNVGNPVLTLNDGVALPVALARHSPASELTVEQIVGSTGLVGLLRFDGGQWGVQPLGVTLALKKGEAFTGSGAYEFVSKKKAKTLAILHERASRLLRQKA